MYRPWGSQSLLLPMVSPLYCLHVCIVIVNQNEDGEQQNLPITENKVIHDVILEIKIGVDIP